MLLAVVTLATDGEFFDVKACLAEQFGGLLSLMVGVDDVVCDCGRVHGSFP